MQTPNDVHNQIVGDIVRQIIMPMVEVKAEATDILLVLESVVTGVLMVVAVPGGREIVLDKLVEGVKNRLKENREKGN